jgi:multiple antibiotic resistance protein
MFDSFSIKETLAATMVLFAIIDILGAIPIIVTLKQKFGKIESEKVAVVSGILMIAFLFIGNKILKFIGVDVNSFAIAGAFVIFIIALEMILGIEIQKSSEAKSASIVPIAFPLIAGAGTLTTVLSLRAQYNDINIILAILINTIFVFIVLKTANWIEQKLGDGTLQILQKVFGIVLLAIAIKLFTSNFAELFSMYVKF